MSINPNPLEGMHLVTPVDMWRAWINDIATDPEMNRDRVMRHLQAHVQQHMPNSDAPPERWEEWMAGSYNLLAILSSMLQISPPHTVGMELLFRKYKSAPTDHTPPPAAAVSQLRPVRLSRDNGS